jgi:hypothetical protein
MATVWLKSFQAASIHVHENYNPATFEGDIATIVLNTTVRISDLIYPACFPFPKQENEQIERFQLSPGSVGIVSWIKAISNWSHLTLVCCISIR